MNDILSVDISSDAVVYVGAAIGAVLFLVLFLRPGRALTQRGLAGAVAGAVIGLLGTWLVADVWNVFQIPITATVRIWVIALCAALGLVVVSFWKSPRWRKGLAAISIPVFLVVAGIGINAEAGIDKTLGAVLGIDTGETVKLPVPGQDGGQEGEVPLWQSWKPPAGMPAAGEQGTHDIPNTHSGFIARPAGIYLPPAAKTAKPPRLPVVVMLMGQPGAPTPQFIGGVLDTFAAANHGLAPIVVVADQIGPDQDDTLCVDSKKYGKVESYIMKDVVGFARDNLGVLQDPKFWTIAGYSNGGQCAISLGAKYPDVFGNILDISGEEFPGAEDPSGNLAQVFNGDQAAYDAQKPINIMAGKHFRDTTAIFTVGALDAGYVPAAQKVSAAARAAGMATSYYEVPDAGHLGLALTGGLQKGFEILYPRLGLSR